MGYQLIDLCKYRKRFLILIVRMRTDDCLLMSPGGFVVVGLGVVGLGVVGMGVVGLGVVGMGVVGLTVVGAEGQRETA